MKNDRDMILSGNRDALLRHEVISGQENRAYDTISLAGHGFSVADVVAIKSTDGTWIKAKADVATTCRTIGIVTEVPDVDTFTVTMIGYIDTLSGLTPGAMYYVSDTTAGALSVTESALVTAPIFVATTATAGYVLAWRPQEPSACIIEVDKVAHGFSIGNVCTISGSLAVRWADGATPSFALADGLGIVAEVISVDKFALCLSGKVKIPGHGITPTGQVVYLGNTPGTLQDGGSITDQSTGSALRAVCRVLDADTLLVFGPDYYSSHQFSLRRLTDVNTTGVGGALGAFDGAVLTYVDADTRWQAKTIAAASLGSHAALSVIGRSANSAGVVSDIAASTTGDVLRMGATTIGWGQLDTASYVDLSVTTAKINDLAVTTGKLAALAVTTAKIAANAVTTAKMDALIAAGGPTGSASVVPVITYDASGRLTAVSTASISMALSGLSDVTITSVADTDFLRYDSGSAKWKNVNLGSIGYITGSGTGTANANAFYFGANFGATPVSMNVAIGAASRLLVNAGASLEFLVRGVVATTDKWAKVAPALVSGTTYNMSFQDDGTEVLSWVCSATPGSRLFDFKVPVQISGASLSLMGNTFYMTGTSGASISGTSTTISVNAGTSNMTTIGYNATVTNNLTVSGTIASGAIASSGTVTATQFIIGGGGGSGITAVYTTAKLTGGGTNGQFTFTGGILTGAVSAT